MMSHDMEDIVAVLDGRPEVVAEVLNCENQLKNHLKARLSAMLTDERFIEALPGHLPGDAGSQARVPIILQRMQTLVAP